MSAIASEANLSSVTNLVNKFRGCLIGGLVGDCLGAPFENDQTVAKTVLTKYMNTQLDQNHRPFQVFPYTDDTAMTKSIAESLLQNKRFDAKDMAKRFTEEYMREPKRGYGHNVVDTFAVLQMTDYEDPLEPARKQFNGSGSYGNGAAMRTGPVPLFGFHLSDQELAELATNCSLITHSNRNGYNGAILQCFAIRQALTTEPTVTAGSSLTSHSVDVKQFLNGVIDKFKLVENKETSSSGDTPLMDKLMKMKDIFNNEAKAFDLSSERVADMFGNNVSALKSVPSAIFSVLRGQKPIDGFDCDNPFVRTLYFAISLGGDTDTIASMACSIAGALYGSDLIPDILQKHCEDIEVMLKFANDLHDYAMNKAK